MNECYFRFLELAVSERFQREIDDARKLNAFLNQLQPEQKRAVFAQAATLAQGQFSRNAIRKWFHGSFQRQFQEDIKQYRAQILRQCQELINQGCDDVYGAIQRQYACRNLNKRELYDLVRYELKKVPIILAPLDKMKDEDKCQIYKDLDYQPAMWQLLVEDFIDEDYLEGGDM